MATFPTNVLCNYFVKIDFRDPIAYYLDKNKKLLYTDSRSARVAELADAHV